MNVQNNTISFCCSLISEVFHPYLLLNLLSLPFSQIASSFLSTEFCVVSFCTRSLFVRVFQVVGVSSLRELSRYFVRRTAFDCLILSAHSTWYSSRVLPAVTWFNDAFSSLVNCPSRLSGWLRFSDGYPSIMSKQVFHAQFRRHFRQ